MATRRTRSSRVLHQSPAFYACYLLKSIRTPRATATYIGSTPSPPRRIRQHNGEISQGAWKTKHNRPWVMQMIVYGFPSKLAALQFEWAWQHPHISRHLRDDEGKSLFSGEKRYIKTNIQVVQTMIACRPYNTWPLHVKLFTSEAVKIWGNVAKEPRTPPPPQGFTMKTELEGVDGKSGLPGSGRTGPIDISDESFTSVHLAKHTALLGSRKQLQCAVCHSDVHTYSTDSLSAALCPSSGCTAVSHLSCLSGHFLSGSTAETTLVPRGGECPVCRTYVLWGDVIKGCYRRHSGKAVLSDPEDTDGDEEGGDCEGEDELVVSANEDELVDQTTSKSPAPTRKAAKRLRVRADSVDVVPNAAKESPPKAPTKRRRRAKAKEPSTSKAGKRSYHTAAAVHSASSGEEFFDLNAISPDEEVDDAPPPPVISQRTPGAHSMIPPREKTKRRTKDVLTANINESDENFDLNAISADDEPDNAPNLPAIPPGRPVAVARRPGLSYEEATKSAPAHDNEGDESFDLDAISEDSDGEPLAQDSRHNTARSYGQQKHSYRRRKSTAHRERPNFDIFQLSGDASPIADPSSSRRHHGLGGQHSPKSIPPPSSRPNAQKYKRLSILEGEVDFFANDGSPSSPDEHSLGLTSRRAMPDLADALSTLSVSSPASSPPRPAAVPRRRDFGDFSDDESQKVIVISD